MRKMIFNISKWVAGVIGGITAIIGITTLIYNQGVKSATNNHEDIEFKTRTISILDTLVKSNSELVISVYEINGKLDKNIEVSNITRNVLKEHVLKTATKEDIINLYDDLFVIKKNNELNSFRIPYLPNN
jgi:hypothetical protein